ncbi:MAG: cytochrome c [Gammaproteobacteria bacterium]|nr:cytochrome c [Gammaproteobacteria bacterium]
MNRRPKKLLHAAIGILVVSSLVATEEIADYRHESMEAIGGHFQSLLKIVRGEVPFDSHVSMHADALADYGEIMDSLFPQGSEGGEALDKIWDEPEEFKKAVEKFKDATQALKEIVDDDGSESDIGSAVREVGMSCRGCHNRYRE